MSNNTELPIAPDLLHPRRAWYKRPWVIVLAVLVILWLGAPQLLQLWPEIPADSNGFTASPLGKSTSSALRVEVVTTDDPARGSPVAPVVIVEFGDFECPFCREAVPIMKQVLAKYPEAVRLIYRDWPVPELHDQAVSAAEAANCANQQGQFWAFHDALYARQAELGSALYQELAQTFSLKLDDFNRCLTGHLTLAEIQDDVSAGFEVGVRGTPTWFVNGRRVEGALPLDLWDRVIKQSLQERFGG